MEIIKKHPEYFRIIEQNQVIEVTVLEPVNFKKWATLLCYSIFLEYPKINQGGSDYDFVKDIICICNRNKWNKKELIFSVYNRYYLLNIKRHDFTEGTLSTLFEFDFYEILISGRLPLGFPFIPRFDSQNNLFLNLPVRLRKNLTTYIP
ncbi:hypothetical protein EOJ36_09515 [Sandaracinomonas limnophila]|uniref:Uncharacterized protein n=1 Tax=Sandaracinomonas limnophila TaxID=1862386 RepID=A0A437PPF6_9BACT|nr:hypothetical protein [Sandaracinomonas limnophila]RVU24153.1 hypothetical protein EOJ36_09515 [Sandaracinomonas limnophila]